MQLHKKLFPQLLMEEFSNSYSASAEPPVGRCVANNEKGSNGSHVAPSFSQTCTNPRRRFHSIGQALTSIGSAEYPSYRFEFYGGRLTVDIHAIGHPGDTANGRAVVTSWRSRRATQRSNRALDEFSEVKMA
jgi:hypothetical protein